MNEKDKLKTLKQFNFCNNYSCCFNQHEKKLKEEAIKWVKELMKLNERIPRTEYCIKHNKMNIYPRNINNENNIFDESKNIICNKSEREESCIFISSGYSLLAEPDENNAIIKWIKHFFNITEDELK